MGTQYMGRVCHFGYSYHMPYLRFRTSAFHRLSKVTQPMRGNVGLQSSCLNPDGHMVDTPSLSFSFDLGQMSGLDGS